MADEKRLIDLDKAFEAINQEVWWTESEKAYFRSFLAKQPKTVAVNVKQYEALREQFHELRENFIDYVCSGTHNLAPYCLNRCEGCVDRVGWCSQGSDECHGFNPAEIII